MDSVNADTALAPHHPHHPAIVHGRKQMRGGVRLSAPVIPHRAVREMFVHFARMHRTARLHELQQQLRALFLFGRPFPHPFGGNAGVETGMHQRLQGSRDEAVDDEEILLDAELHVAAFEIARAIAVDAMAQNQILSAGRSANGIGLHEAHFVESAFQRGGRKKTARHGESPDVVESHTVYILMHRFWTPEMET